MTDIILMDALWCGDEFDKKKYNAYSHPINCLKGYRVPEPERIFSAREAGERLGTTRRAVVSWIRKGRFPNAYKLDPFGVTSPYQIPESDIIAFERKRQGLPNK
jgi:hypothetical protein